jgi:hypothetical protein
MKFWILATSLVFSGVVSAAPADAPVCDLDHAQFLIDEGMQESLSNDCGDDGPGLKDFSSAWDNFSSYYKEDECAGQFEPRVQAYLECSAMDITNGCVSKNNVKDLKCEELTKGIDLAPAKSKIPEARTSSSR